MKKYKLTPFLLIMVICWSLIGGIKVIRWLKSAEKDRVVRMKESVSLAKFSEERFVEVQNYILKNPVDSVNVYLDNISIAKARKDSKITIPFVGALFGTTNLASQSSIASFSKGEYRYSISINYGKIVVVLYKTDIRKFEGAWRI